MEKSEHVMMVGKGAEKFAAEAGLEIIDPKYFWTKDSWEALQRIKKQDSTKMQLDHHDKKSLKLGIKNRDSKFGTVIMKKVPALGGDGGLIALDKDGNVSMPFNTAGMYRGTVTKDGKIEVFIYKE